MISAILSRSHASLVAAVGSRRWETESRIVSVRVRVSDDYGWVWEELRRSVALNGFIMDWASSDDRSGSRKKNGPVVGMSVTVVKRLWVGCIGLLVGAQGGMVGTHLKNEDEFHDVLYGSILAVYEELTVNI